MSERSPVWSVVVPVYNKAPYIESTLRSVLCQKGRPEFEIVVVDDGSRDASASVVEALDDSRIRLVRQPNAGVSAARNRGVREALGDWVVFLDGDDLLHPAALMAYGQMASRFPDARVLAGKDQRIATTGVAAFRFTQLPDPLPLREIENLPQVFVKEGLPFSSSSIAIRRDFLQQQELNFPEGESMGEDLDVWLRAAEHASVVCTPEALVVYRIGLSESLMGRYSDAVWLPVWRRLRQRALTGGMPAQLRASSLRLAAEMEVTLARRLAKAGRNREAWRHLSSARAAARGHRWWITALGLSTGWKSLWSR